MVGWGSPDTVVDRTLLFYFLRTDDDHTGLIRVVAVIMDAFEESLCEDVRVFVAPG